jgi:RNA polymerase sigma-54 factor
MAVSQRLELRQSQSLVMTPQLQQAIKLLQFNNLELAAYVDHELEQNPFLERAAADPTAAGSATPTPETPTRGDEDNLDDRSGEADWDGAPPTMPDWGASGPGGGSNGPVDDDELSGLEQRLGDATTLREHLLSQARLLVATPVEAAIAEALIDSLDDAGYLGVAVTDLADLLGVDAVQIESVRQRLLGIDPAGALAVSLGECLGTQLHQRDRLDPAMATLLRHLDLLAEGHFAKLQKLCGVDSEDLTDMAAELRRLQPRPALAFGGEPVRPLVPDILMRALPDGSFAVELNPDSLPRVLVNNRYYAQIAGGARSKDDKSFLNESLQSANWLVRALDQRANTILKVAGEIVRQQQMFFLHGVRHLRPMTLREIAEAISMHESTVSRVTASKYIASPRGIYELKYFFSAAISGANGASHSAEAVRHRIKALIDAERPDAVLSDERLVELLGKEGIDIARRTVAKYREAMKIPSSSRRKRAKALHSGA